MELAPVHYFPVPQLHLDPALALPFQQLNALCSGFLQCSGDMVTPSILNAVMCALDVAFNTLFIPRYGVLGAGLGTGLACAVISLVMAWRCCFCNAALRLRRKETGRFESEILRKALKIGLPVAVQEALRRYHAFMKDHDGGAVARA